MSKFEDFKKSVEEGKDPAIALNLEDGSNLYYGTVANVLDALCSLNVIEKLDAPSTNGGRIYKSLMVGESNVFCKHKRRR